VTDAQKIKEMILFLKETNKLKVTDRYKSTLDEVGDTVAEHSWRLGLMTFLIANQFNIEMNVGHAIQLALVHDLAEAKTDDIDVYQQITKHISTLQKATAEDKAMQEMTDGFSFGDEVYKLWEEYEKQETKESQFIKALDKIEALLHLSEVGAEHYQQSKFYANYADEVVSVFPQLAELLEVIKADLKKQFKKAGVEWKEK
jgi:putative hydrolases of HD superfamily